MRKVVHVLALAGMIFGLGHGMCTDADAKSGSSTPPMSLRGMGSFHIGGREVT